MESTVLQCIPCLGDSVDEGKAKQRSRQLDKQLKSWNSSESGVIKLLLLGTGESGKSTVTKQMRIIHVDGFSDRERLEKIPDIRKNLRDAILTIVGAMGHLGIRAETPDNEARIRYLLEYACADRHDFPQEFYEHTERLWEDAGVQRCFSQSNKYQLIDSAKYFLDRILILRAEDYMPTDQDMLRCRQMTNAIHRIDFGVRDSGTEVQFSVFDVGGQRGERRKWIQVFDSATAIVFLVDCSSFDLVLREDHTKNRLLECAEIFEQVWNNRWLRKVSIIVFINKIDVLADKITAGKSLNNLIDEMDPSHKYYSLFSGFKTFMKPSESDKQEFLMSYPRGEPGAPRSSVLSTNDRKRSRQMSYLVELDEEIIRTAVFIKNIFVSLKHKSLTYPQKSGEAWHHRHFCEFYYTCAVDTHTIKKVLEGCRSVIIKEHLKDWSIL